VKTLQPIFGAIGLLGLLASPVIERYAGIAWAAFGLVMAWVLIWLAFRRAPQ
jgi:hypothetical protein